MPVLDFDERLGDSWRGDSPLVYARLPSLITTARIGARLGMPAWVPPQLRELSRSQGCPAPYAPGGIGVSITLVPVSSACTTMPPPMYITTWYKREASP